jgi:hypothetical protein
MRITVKRNMGFENRCTSIVRATGKEFLIAVKSFQDKSLKETNERRQPFCCHRSDGEAFSLIPNELYFIVETLLRIELVKPTSVSH